MVVRKIPTGIIRCNTHNLFAREHGGCSEGFIPVQRSYPQHEQLFRKHQAPPHEADRSANPSRSSASNSNNLPHDYAVVAGPTNVGGYTGQGAVISVNDPFIGDPSAEFSLSQLWIIAGSYNLLYLHSKCWYLYSVRAEFILWQDLLHFHLFWHQLQCWILVFLNKIFNYCCCLVFIKLKSWFVSPRCYIFFKNLFPPLNLWYQEFAPILESSVGLYKHRLE